MVNQLAQDHARRARKAGTAAFVGTSIEWYDFYAYATAAAIIFPRAFFPEDQDPALANFVSLGLFAVAFFVRPLGGIVFGALGDRIGRRPTLIITLTLIGLSTLLVGFVPGYDTWGMWGALILLILRAAQGLAIGGEWGGAALLSVESAPEGKKFFYGGFTQLGNPAGAMLASGMFAVISMATWGPYQAESEWLHDWGWRVPFWFSGVLVVIGLIVRLRADESPVFEDKVRGREQSSPFMFAIRNNWLPILLGAGMMTIASGGYSLGTTWVQNYGSQIASDAVERGWIEQHLLIAMTVASFVELLVTLPIAFLSDKISGKRMMYIGLAASAITMIPLVLVLELKSMVWIYVFVILVRVAMSATYAPLAGLKAQMFRPQSRFTSVSLAYGLGAAIWGGLTPIMANGVIHLFGTEWAVIGLFVVLSAIAWLATHFAPQHSDAAPVTRSFTPRLDTRAVSTVDAPGTGDSTKGGRS